MFWIVIAVFGLVAVFLVVLPDKVLSLHARQYLNHYPTERERAALDKAQELNPISRWVIGKMSDYALQGPQAPDCFPRMVAFVRLVGVVLMLATCAAIWLAVSAY